MKVMTMNDYKKLKLSVKLKKKYSVFFKIIIWDKEGWECYYSTIMFLRW
jgi:hypothetical protein